MVLSVTAFTASCCWRNISAMARAATPIFEDEKTEGSGRRTSEPVFRVSAPHSSHSAATGFGSSQCKLDRWARDPRFLVMEGWFLSVLLGKKGPL